ncbi:MAG: UDP-glucose/GDP-mannose dehydrogenase family protein [Actinomycetota bacterium]
MEFPPDFVSRTVAVIGAGYVGIPTATVLAESGHRVILAERDDARRNLLAQSRSPILEVGLDEILARTMGSGQLHVVASAEEAVRGAEFVFLCVATPKGLDGRPDMSFIDAVVDEIRDSISPTAIIVNKSTVPVGTIDRVAIRLGISVDRLVSNPEFLSEGQAVADSLHPDRIVVGSSSRESAEAVAQLFARTSAPVVITDAMTSELIKYASNAFLATKLSFINTMARLCDQLGANVDELVAGIGSDHRIGFSFMQPGPGWGGSCLPKDTSALALIAEDVEVDLSVVRAAMASNVVHQKYIAERIAALVGGSLNGVTIAVLGLSFKANTRDRRDSPAIAICELLVAAGAIVRAYEPTCRDGDVASDLTGLVLATSVREAAEGASAMVVLTEWPEFSALDFTDLATVMAEKILYDARGVVTLTDALAAGFTIESIGKK